MSIGYKLLPDLPAHLLPDTLANPAAGVGCKTRLDRENEPTVKVLMCISLAVIVLT